MSGVKAGIQTNILQFKTVINVLMMSSNLPAVRRLPSEGGTEEILSTSDGGAMGTIVGTPETKYGGKVGDCGVEVPDLMRLPASYTVTETHIDFSERKTKKQSNTKPFALLIL